MPPEDLKTKTNEEVADYMLRGLSTSEVDYQGRVEFLRRQTQAIQETANCTKRYTKYMLWSVVLLLISVLGTLFFNLFIWLSPKLK